VCFIIGNKTIIASSILERGMGFSQKNNPGRQGNLPGYDPLIEGDLLTSEALPGGR